VVPRETFGGFTPGVESLKQLLFSCNDENCADIDRHDDGNPYDLANPRQGEKAAEKQDKEKYANLY
jgi:hypothetical protein